MSNYTKIRAKALTNSKKIAVVASDFNELIVEKLIQGAEKALAKYSLAISECVHVPGAFEIPLTAQRLALTKKYDGIIGLGCVIRGETSHFDYVAGQAAAGILQVGLATNVPIVFGILTTESLEQALDRCGGKGGNKGYDAAMSLTELLSVFEQIDEI